jgi:RNA polymerase sigma-70 factor (ECF subfamily)
MITDLNDEMLVEMLKEGDIRALGELYPRYGSMVKAALQRFAPEMGGADVDELCQDVFLALNDTINRYEEQSRLKGWLYGIAIRKAKTWRRNTWLRRKLLNRRCEEAVTFDHLEANTPQRSLELRQEVESVLGRLSEKQREVLLLFSVEGFSCEETASILGVEIGVVWSRLHRARQTMAKARGISVAEGVYEGEL